MTPARVVGVAAKETRLDDYKRKPQTAGEIQPITNLKSETQCACDHDSANFQKQQLNNHGLLMELKTISCTSQVCKAVHCSE